MEIFMLVVGIGIGAATLVIVQALAKARDDSEEQRSQVAELKTLLDVERMRLDQMSGEIERANIRIDKAAATHFDDHGLMRKFISDAQAMRVDVEKAIDVMGEAIHQQENRLRELDTVLKTVGQEQSNVHGTLTKWMHSTFGEFDVRQQLLTQYYRELDEKVEALEARVAHRRRKPKEANPTDGTTENDPVISAGDLIPLNPEIFKEVNPSSIDE